MHSVSRGPWEIIKSLTTDFLGSLERNSKRTSANYSNSPILVLFCVKLSNQLFKLSPPVEINITFATEHQLLILTTTFH